MELENTGYGALPSLLRLTRQTHTQCGSMTDGRLATQYVLHSLSDSEGKKRYNAHNIYPSF